MRTLALATLVLSLITLAYAFVITKDGYFYDADAQKSFVPRGISYQTFVQDIGQWITYAQIDYDLREMKKANINSIRVDFAWRDIENDGEGVYDWDRFDFLVNICEQYDMKIFPLIGYQWPPSWFEGGMDVGKAVADGEHDKAGWYSLHPPSPAPGIDVLPETFIYKTYWISDVMSFVHPKSIEKYMNFLAAVTGRYKNSKAIAGWVAGNEYGYLGLWSFRYDGYEPVAQEDFRTYLKNLYNNDINQLNQVWGSKHSDFSQVIIPPVYSRESQAWGDATQWRKNAVSKFIAKGSEAVAKADPNHLRSYSMVGMIFGGVDNMFHCEDPMTIVAHCRDHGYPLHFWSINNYPSSYPGNELRSGTFGIEYAKGTGIPVLYTETGSSSTDAGYIGFDDPEVRMGALLRNNVWEAYLNGVVGVHIFTWPDRDYITVREYGFGILKRYREPKKCYQYILEMFYQIALIEQHTPQLLTSLKYAAFDVAFYWPSHTTDQMFNRYQNNMAGVWGPLTRLGLRSRFMNETQLLGGDYKNIKLLILPRNQRMNPGELQFIHDNVLPAGVHVYSEADLPGMEDYHIRRHADFEPLMDKIFGLKPKVINAYNDNPVAYNIHMTPYVTVELLPTISMAPMRAYESTWFGTWKYHVVEPTSGQIIVNMLVNKTLGPYPAIIQKKHEKASAIASAFALGDTNCEALKCWIGHYVYYKGLFLSPQGLNLPTSIGIEGSPMVQAFLIDTYDNMKILYIHNWDDYSHTAGVQLTVPSIIGMTVKDMLNNRRVIAESCSGVLTFDLAPNDLRILLINEPLKPFVSFIYNQTEVDIHPNLRGSKITVKFDTSRSKEKCTLRVKLLAEGSTKVFAKVATQVQGVGWTTTRVPIVDFSPFDKGYQSTSQGRNYYYEASISCPGMDTSSSTINVMVSWPVAPKTLTNSVTANSPVTTTISWENFPIARLNAFQGVVAIWNSTKTQKVDPTHYAKVARVASILESIGYTYSRMVAWDEGLQDYGPLYHVYNDTIPTDPSGKGSLAPKYFAELIKFLILPGVTVMNDAEVNNVRIWATCSNFTDMTLISIDGMPGIYNERGDFKPDRFTDIFGTSNTYVPGGSSGKLTVTDANHPITQSIGANTWDITPGTFAATAVANGGKAYGSITSNTGTYPAIITNQITNDQKAIVLNFDATTDNKVFPTKTFWTYVQKWAHLNSLIYKLRWTATCATDNKAIGATDAWIMQGTGSMGVTVTPTATCNDVVWKGWVAYWNQTNPADSAANMGYYTSENDMKFIPNSVAKIGFGYALAIVFATMMLLL